MLASEIKNIFKEKEKLAAFCDKGMAFSFYALIYFLPISIALSEIFTSMALLFWFIKRGAGIPENFRKARTNIKPLSFFHKISIFLGSFNPISNYLNVPIALFLLTNLISVLKSQYIHVSIEGFLGKTLQSAFLYFNFIECMNSRRRLQIFLIIFFVSAGLICANGIYQSFVGAEFIRGHFFDGRISSSFRHANDFAAYLVIITPILWAVVFYAVGRNFLKRSSDGLFAPGATSMYIRKLIPVLLLFFVALLCLGWTYSRGAWMGFLFSLIFFSFLQRKNIFINLFIIILFLGIFYPQLEEYRQMGLISDRGGVSETQQAGQGARDAQIKQKTASAVYDSASAELDGQGRSAGGISGKVLTYIGSSLNYRLQHIVNLMNSFGGSGRGAYWREALRMIKDYPVFGVGLNAYSLVAPRYKITWGGYPHNCYLQMLVEIGVVGFLSFMWVLFRIFRNGIRDFKGLDDPFLRILLLGVLAGFAGFLAHSFFDTNFFSVQLGSFMWLVMGLIAAIPNIQKNGEHNNTIAESSCKMSIPHISRTTIGICLFLLILFLCLLVYLQRTNLNPRYGLIFYEIGIKCQQCSFQKKLGYFQKALHYDPNLSKAHYELGVLYEQKEDKETALAFYRKAASLDYRYADAHSKVGYQYFVQGDWDNAYRYLRQGRKYGTRGDMNYFLGVLYEMRKEYQEAFSYYNMIVCPPSVYCVEALARKGAMLHLLDKDNHAMSVVADLRTMQRNDLADQLQRFIETNQLPEFMNTPFFSTAR